jgi:hypothetical protein
MMCVDFIYDLLACELVVCIARPNAGEKARHEERVSLSLD